MPTVKDKTTGEVVAELPYDAQGKEKADQMVQASPNLEIDYAPGGASDAMTRSTTTYLEGGKVMPYAVSSVIDEIIEEDYHNQAEALAQSGIASISKLKKIKASRKRRKDEADAQEKEDKQGPYGGGGARGGSPGF